MLLDTIIILILIKDLQPVLEMTHDYLLSKSAQFHGSGIADDASARPPQAATFRILENSGSTHMLIATKYT